MAKRSPLSRPDRDLVEIDRSVAHASRVYDYLLGGTDNFAVDRQAAEHVFAVYPGGVDGARTDARANRGFLKRAVGHLAGEAGIRQFLDIGTGIPNDDNTHAVAQEAAPDSHVVYVDNDPIVLAHAHSLRKAAASGGHSEYIDGDLRDPETILARAAGTLDLEKPVAVMLVGLLHVVPDDHGPHGAVAALMDAVPSGSYLAISHITTDLLADEMAEVVDRLDRTMGPVNPPAFRTRAEVARFFEGLELVDPGIVQADRWRPDPATPTAPAERVVPLYCAVGRKP